MDIPSSFPLLLPPLLRLPIELHRDIVDHLELQDRVRLRLTSRYFTSIIKPPTCQELLAAEATPWAFSRDLFTCKDCVRFRHLLKFTDDMRKGKRGRQGSEAHTRYCVDCGVAHRRYKPDTEITIMGQPYVVCRYCKTYTDRIGSKGACTSCIPVPKSVQKGMKEPYTGYSHSQYESEDDWSYSTRSYAGGKHSEEMYGLWPDL
ncbi:F-box domain-containing protein [Zopfia rhizophila CBS 207.26]|uniref:F-box domain-containing protein n=1 Tax=Zopfia rhizophila CBS 207.26 TaxID=1314779 RepID=A0A6A6EAC9_9PEZI|nr:F-box domain-containing protein [Zopfia rhizophila CBS 207.26]